MRETGVSLDYLPGKLGPEEQKALLDALRAVMAEAPLFTPAMPRSGKPMSVRMTNCGPLGWVTAVGASAAATGASVVLPDLIERFRAQARGPVVVVPEPPALGH